MSVLKAIPKKRKDRLRTALKEPVFPSGSAESFIPHRLSGEQPRKPIFKNVATDVIQMTNFLYMIFHIMTTVKSQAWLLSIKSEIVYSLKPQNNANPELTEKINAVNKELTRTGIALDAVLKRYGVDSIESMSSSMYNSALNSLRKTKSKAA